MRIRCTPVPGRKDGKRNAPGQGAPKKAEEDKRHRWVLYLTDADRASMEALAKAAKIDLKKKARKTDPDSKPKEDAQLKGLASVITTG